MIYQDMIDEIKIQGWRTGDDIHDYTWGEAIDV